MSSDVSNDQTCRSPIVRLMLAAFARYSIPCVLPVPALHFFSCLHSHLAESFADLVLVVLLGELPVVDRQRDVHASELALQQVHHPHQAGDFAFRHSEAQAQTGAP